MMVTMSDGSGTSTKPHHTPSPEAQQTLPTATSSPSLPPVVDEPASLIRDDSQDLEISQLKARVKLLEDREGGGITQSREDTPIKRRSLDEGEEAAIERISVAEVPTGSGSIPTASPPGTEVPTGSGSVPTASLIFTTATVATPYTRRKDAEIARIHAKEELQIMIDGLDRNNETVAKYLQEYYQFAGYLPIRERIELISNLVKYQDNYAKVLKYQIQQRKPLSRKQQEFYMSVLKSHVEESERFKRKGIRLEHDSTTKVKTSEEVPKENLKEMMQLIPVKEVYVDALQVKHPIIDWEALVKETLNIRQATSDKEKELWVELKRLYEPDVEDLLWNHTQNMMHAPVEWKLYDTCKVHHVISKDQEMFMLVEKDYPLRKGLAIVMISYKLQVKNYSQMANDLILKIHKIANSPRQQDD
nr:hypothetical protein [Tanacetum cinerariifolium]